MSAYSYSAGLNRRMNDSGWKKKNLFAMKLLKNADRMMSDESRPSVVICCVHGQNS